MPAKKIGELLVESGLITEGQLEEVLQESKRRSGTRIGSILVKKGYATEMDIAQTLSFQLSIPFIDIPSATIEPEAINAVSERLAKRYLLIPLYFEGKILVIAMADPLNLNAIDDVRFSTGLQLRPLVGTPTGIAEAIRLHYHLSQPIEGLIDDLKIKPDSLVEILHEQDTERDLAEQVKKSAAPPIIKIVDSIIVYGAENRASDIHLEPQEKWVIVRIRVDGIMKEAMQLPKWVQGSVVSRIKLMAKMDIVERRISQDGRIKVRMGEKTLDLRISTLPTQYGETVVMRVLDPKAEMIRLNNLGLQEKEQSVIDVIERPQGVVMVTGPTGCGKTSTLYSMIEHIKGEEINIITIEDPIEYELSGVNQVNVNEKTGLTFAFTLRSVLRQDPDVILVGEMRDPETALIAFQASMTGHLVFSTLHTNDAVSSIIRLKNLGIPPYLIASSLNGIVAQRLVRKICPQCKESYPPTTDEMKRLGVMGMKDQNLYRGRGCKSCKGSGYTGRVGIFEVLVLNNKIRDMIAADVLEQNLSKAVAEAGMASMQMDGIRKVAAGITTLEELNRVVYLAKEDKELTGVCPSCLQPIMENGDVCPHCDHLIKKNCPSCGKARQPEWIICPFCAALFEVPKNPALSVKVPAVS